MRKEHSLWIFLSLFAAQNSLAQEANSKASPPHAQSAQAQNSSPDYQDDLDTTDPPGHLEDQSTEHSTENAAEVGPKITAPDWMIMLSPSAGFINNKVKVKFRIPRQNGYEDSRLTMEDNGWGPGLVAVGMYKRLVLVNVLYLFPKVNHSLVIGGMSQLSATIPTPIFVKPYLAAGLFYQVSKTHMENFVDSLDSHMSNGTLTTGYGYFDELNVRCRILNPFPEIGARFMLPIQHWYITPYYSAWFDFVKSRTRAPNGGEVYIYNRGHEQPETKPTWDDDWSDAQKEQAMLDNDWPMEPIMVKPFDKPSDKLNISHLVGAWINIDFNYFLQLQANLYYNLTHKLFSARLIGTVQFSKYVGLSAYFEYQNLEMVDNIYFFIGPSFVFFPPGWIDNVWAVKDQKIKAWKERRKSN